MKAAQAMVQSATTGIDSARIPRVGSLEAMTWVEDGSRVALVGARESLRRMLEVIGLRKVLPAFDDADTGFVWFDAQRENAGAGAGRV